LCGVESRLAAPRFAMTYNLTSDKLVERTMVLGNRSLLAPQVDLRASSRSLPQIAQQATGSSPLHLEHHFALQSSRQVAHSDKPTAMNSVLFSQVLSHINCIGAGITQEAWQGQRGRISSDCPWGADFWNGFTSFMATEYLPRKMHHVGVDAFLPGWFTMPMTFSKSAAEAPKSDLNPGSSKKYTCFVLSFGYNHPYYQSVCVHQALLLLKHWKVHESWLEFFARA
jgi:hypothetical protein